MIQIQFLVPSEDQTRSSNYLLNADSFFSPLLSQQVNLHDYVAKVSQKAHILFAVEGGKDIGACFFYMNDQSKIAYITSFSVSPLFHRRGIGRRLLCALRQCCIDHQKERIELEVYSHNQAAQKLYSSFGFVPLYRTECKIKMTYQIDP